MSRPTDIEAVDHSLELLAAQSTSSIEGPWAITDPGSGGVLFSAAINPSDGDSFVAGSYPGGVYRGAYSNQQSRWYFESSYRGLRGTGVSHLSISDELPAEQTWCLCSPRLVSAAGGGGEVWQLYRHIPDEDRWQMSVLRTYTSIPSTSPGLAEPIELKFTYLALVEIVPLGTGPNSKHVLIAVSSHTALPVRETAIADSADFGGCILLNNASATSDTVSYGGSSGPGVAAYSPLLLVGFVDWPEPDKVKWYGLPLRGGYKSTVTAGYCKWIRRSGFGSLWVSPSSGSTVSGALTMRHVSATDAQDDVSELVSFEVSISSFGSSPTIKTSTVAWTGASATPLARFSTATKVAGRSFGQVCGLPRTSVGLPGPGFLLYVSVLGPTQQSGLVMRVDPETSTVSSETIPFNGPGTTLSESPAENLGLFFLRSCSNGTLIAAPYKTASGGPNLLQTWRGRTAAGSGSSLVWERISFPHTLATITESDVVQMCFQTVDDVSEALDITLPASWSGSETDWVNSKWKCVLIGVGERIVIPLDGSSGPPKTGYTITLSAFGKTTSGSAFAATRTQCAVALETLPKDDCLELTDAPSQMKFEIRTGEILDNFRWTWFVAPIGAVWAAWKRSWKESNGPIQSHVGARIRVDVRIPVLKCEIDIRLVGSLGAKVGSKAPSLSTLPFDILPDPSLWTDLGPSPLSWSAQCSDLSSKSIEVTAEGVIAGATIKRNDLVTKQGTIAANMNRGESWVNDFVYNGASQWHAIALSRHAPIGAERLILCGVLEAYVSRDGGLTFYPVGTERVVMSGDVSIMPPISPSSYHYWKSSGLGLMTLRDIARLPVRETPNGPISHRVFALTDDGGLFSTDEWSPSGALSLTRLQLWATSSPVFPSIEGNEPVPTFDAQCTESWAVVHRFSSFGITEHLLALGNQKVVARGFVVLSSSGGATWTSRVLSGLPGGRVTAMVSTATDDPADGDGVVYVAVAGQGVFCLLPGEYRWRATGPFRNHLFAPLSSIPLNITHLAVVRKEGFPCLYCALSAEPPIPLTPAIPLPAELLPAAKETVIATIHSAAGLFRLDVWPSKKRYNAASTSESDLGGTTWVPVVGFGVSAALNKPFRHAWRSVTGLCGTSSGKLGVTTQSFTPSSYTWSDAPTFEGGAFVLENACATTAEEVLPTLIMTHPDATGIVIDEFHRIFLLLGGNAVLSDNMLSVNASGATELPKKSGVPKNDLFSARERYYTDPPEGPGLPDLPLQPRWPVGVVAVQLPSSGPVNGVQPPVEGTPTSTGAVGFVDWTENLARFSDDYVLFRKVGGLLVVGSRSNAMRRLLLPPVGSTVHLKPVPMPKRHVQWLYPIVLRSRS